MNSTIDWSSFDKYLESNCECSCGVTFQSHAKAVRDGISWTLVSRKPCPKCGKSSGLRSIRSDSENG